MDTNVIIQAWPLQITLRKGDVPECIDVEVWHMHTGQTQTITVKSGEHGLETSMGGSNAG